MLIINPQHLNQIGCHIITAVVLEISVVGQGTLVLTLRKGGFRIVHGHNVFYVLWIWQRFDIFLNSSAGTSVWYTTVPGVHSANCCNTIGILVKRKVVL